MFGNGQILFAVAGYVAGVFSATAAKPVIVAAFTFIKDKVTKKNG